MDAFSSLLSPPPPPPFYVPAFSSHFQSLSLASFLVADAVFESVAQVLLSCSRGLRSRFKQATIKADAEVRNVQLIHSYSARMCAPACF